MYDDNNDEDLETNPEEIETDLEEVPTRVMSLSISGYKRPNIQPNADLNVSRLRFILPTNIQVDLLCQDALTIGRQQDNPYTVDLDLDPFGGAAAGVSRLHAEIRLLEGSLCICDTFSKNGVYLNGEELYPRKNYKLHDKDMIRFGNVECQVLFIRDDAEVNNSDTSG